jgi:glycosyltransferase involved in cell wall biosynthesis
MVSILIPTYRQEPFIAKAVASALSQDYPSLEVVVIDDNSPDGTGETLARWGCDPRFRYVRNSHNRGRVANYRHALTELARGQWVLMLDGDDFLTDPSFIRRAIGAIDRHHDRPIVFAQAGHRAHFLNGNARDADILPPIDGVERVMAGGDYLRFVFETGFFTHLGTLYHKDRAIAAGAYTADISSSDMDSLLRLALEGEVIVLNTIAGAWVQHGANASSNLPLDELLPNVRLFRRVARLAVARGLTTWPRIDGPLTRYEARTLAHLFKMTIGKTSNDLWAMVRLVGIGLRVNVRLLGNRAFLSRCLGFARTLASLSAQRSRWGRVAARAFRVVDGCYRRLLRR